MSDTLAERLAERLDIQPEQTDRLVRTFAQLIKTQASRDGQVRVPGLGIFEQQAKALTFEPDPDFAETVNPKYAHLPTVSVATHTPPVADTLEEPDAVVDQEAPEAQGDTAPALEADDIDQPSFAPPPFEPEDTSDEEDAEEALPASFLDEEEPAETDIPDDAAYTVTPYPLPQEEIEHDFSDAFVEEEEEPEAEDEVSAFDEPDLEEEPVFTDETTWEDDADQEDEDFIASLLAEEPEDLDDEDSDSEDRVEEAFEEAEPSEEDTYAALEQESASFEEDTFLEESEPSAWAPPGTRWTGENKDQLVPIEDDETEAASPPPIEDTEQDEAIFAPAPLKAVPKAALEEPPSAKGDLPPRPSARMRHYPQEPEPSGRSVWPWLLAALLFVVVAGGAYYYFNLREQPIAVNEVPPAEQPTDADEPAVTPPAEEEPSPEDPTSETDTAPDDVAEETPPSEETTPEQPPASTGPIDQTQGGYTLVVGSRGSQDAAEADAERIRQALNEASIPVDVLQGTVNGTTRYRIGVGQVATTEAALALKQRLGNRISADAWVTRILPDS
jgi:nucleoid DNA-binding protein